MMDALTLSIGIGLIVSLLLSEAFGLAAGGMIVPGYFAFYMNRPVELVLTLLAALATFGIVRLVSKYSIVYGRRRIVVTIFVGFFIGALIRTVPMIAQSWSFTDANVLNHIAVIGFIIPGLIALWLDRQGVTETFAGLMTSSAIVRLVLILLPLEILT